MRKIKIIFLLLCWIVIPGLLSAVHAQNNAGIARVTISSPNASSLGKFGDIPVSEHTGIPNISIPIYTIKSGTLELNIGLSYHASGLKVQEQASWVGAGWALNAGGVITRTVVGAPDDKGLHALYTDKGHYTDYGYNSYLFSPGPATCVTPNICAQGRPGMPPNSNAPQDTYIQTGKFDGQPDLFFFNFSGYSGKFYFNDDRTPVIVPGNDLKIVPIYTGSDWRGFSGFIITTPDGTRYYFGQNQDNDGNIDATEITYNTSTQMHYNGQGASSSWYLNKIVSADGQFMIRLIYQPESYSYYTLSMYPIPAPANPNAFANNSEYDLDKNFISGVRLSKISFANGEVDFNPGALRQDLSLGTGPYPNFTYTGIEDAANNDAALGGRSLGSIDIRTNTSCKKDSFYFGYFSDNNALTGNLLTVAFPNLNLVSDKYRLRLDSIRESTCDASIKIPAYKFTYFSGTVPRKLSFGIDHWGFYNGVTTNSGLIPTYTVAPPSGSGAATTFQGADRDTHWPGSLGGTLQQITYPTGGSSNFDYESNDVYTGNATALVGGLRIKTVTTSDGVTANNIITSYRYKFNNLPNGQSSGILFSRPVYVQGLRNDAWAVVNGASCSQYGCFFCFGSDVAYYRSPSSIRPMSTTQGNHIGYGEVYISHTGNGYTEKRYYSSNGAIPHIWDPPVPDVCVRNISTYCDPNIPSSPAPPDPFDPIRGELAFEGHFSESGQLLKNSSYIPLYQFDSLTTPGIISKFFVTAYVSSGTQVDPMQLDPLNMTPSNGFIPIGINTFTEYAIRSAKKIRDSVVTMTYDPQTGNYLTDINTIYYGSYYHHQPTQALSYSSRGETRITNIKRALDFRIGNFTVPDQTATYDANIAGDNTYLGNAIGGVTRSPTDPQYYWDRLNIYSNYRYMKAIDRQTYINYRRQNFTDANNAYQADHDAAKAVADAALKPILELQDGYRNPVVEQSNWKGGKLVKAEFTQYDYGANPVNFVYPSKTQLVNPGSSSAAFTNADVSGNGLVKDSRYADESAYRYSAGNPVQVTAHDGIPVSYIWDYLNSEPIAKVTGATADQIAFTSFEADGGGGFYINNPAGITTSNTLTGKKSYFISNAMAKFNLDPSKTYIISLWAAYDIPNYNGFNGNTQVIADNNAWTTGITKGGWTYLEKKMTGVTTINIGGGAGQVDEVRLYPQDAQMVSYTYAPQVGMTSSCDVNNRVTLYEYDALNRLSLVRDQDNNILKKYCYNYQGQSEACSAFFGNAIQTRTYYSTKCGMTGAGTAVNYVVPANRYFGANQAAADAQALNEIGANGQAWADAQNSCIYHSDIQQGFFTKNDCVTGTGTTVTYIVDDAKYSSTVSKADANQQALNDLYSNGQTYANDNGSCSSPQAYARLEIYPSDFTNECNSYDCGWNQNVQIYLKFYSDAACTQPLTVWNSVDYTFYHTYVGQTLSGSTSGDYSYQGGSGVGINSVDLDYINPWESEWTYYDGNGNIVYMEEYKDDYQISIQTAGYILLPTYYAIQHTPGFM